MLKKVLMTALLTAMPLYASAAENNFIEKDAMSFEQYPGTIVTEKVNYGVVSDILRAAGGKNSPFDHDRGRGNDDKWRHDNGRRGHDRDDRWDRDDRRWRDRHDDDDRWDDDRYEHEDDDRWDDDRYEHEDDDRWDDDRYEHEDDDPWDDDRYED
mgnify:CR=1 FL=1